MSIRKKVVEAKEVEVKEVMFEEVTKQADRVEQFSVEGLERQITAIDERIVKLEEEKTALEAKITSAKAL